MAEKLSIGMLSFYYPHLGGSGIMATRIGAELAKAGHEVHFIGYDTDYNPPMMQELGVRLHPVGRIDYPCLKNEPYIWTMATKICSVHDQYGLDVVHVHYALPHAMSAMLARQQLEAEGRRLPYVVTGHGSDIHTNGYKKDVGRMLRLVLNSADAISYVSNDLKNIAEEEIGVYKQGQVISNFVMTDRFFKSGSNIRRKHSIPDDAFVVGHASNFAPVKQTYHITELAKNLASEGLLGNTYFLLAGEGAELAARKAEAESAGLADRFRFIGKIEPEMMPAFYNSADLFLLPSKREGCPLSLLEAMACGVPVITTNTGGLPELVDGTNGYVFDPGDYEQLTRHVLELRADPSLRERMAEEGIRRVMRHHSVPTVMEEYHRLYRSVMLREPQKMNDCVDTGLKSFLN